MMMMIMMMIMMTPPPFGGWGTPPPSWGGGGPPSPRRGGGEKGAPPFGKGPAAARQGWLAWPWASQASMPGRCRAPAVLAACIAFGMQVGGGVCRGAEGLCTHSGARSRVLSDACIVHCEGVFAAIISGEGRGPEIPGGGLRNRCCVVTPARQRRMTSPLGARRKERSASPRPLRQHILCCRCFMPNA